MANQKQLFRQHHVTRALRGAVAAGMSNPTVQVRLTDGAATITVGSSDGGKGAGGKKSPAHRAPSRAPRAGRGA
jgi:hypothetical protein